MMNLSKAIKIASSAHENQNDKSGKPYILHCIAVMRGVKRWDDEELSIMAILHDLIEDTHWILETSKESSPFNFAISNLGYGPVEISKRVYDGLMLLTRRKDISYNSYIHMISQNKDATRVKMADLEHNSQIFRLKGIKEKDINRMIKYHTAYTRLKESLCQLDGTIH